MVECLDGLDFSFGPASFQQVNLQVFEKILQENGLHGFHGHFMGISWSLEIYGYLVAPCSIHALAAIGFKLRKHQSFQNYDMTLRLKTDAEITSNSLLFGYVWTIIVIQYER